MNKMIFVLLLSLVAFSKSNDYLREMARGIVKGYYEKDEPLNQTCLDTNFDEDYASLLKGIEEENYSFMSLKLYKITLELDTNCKELANLIKAFPKLDLSYLMIIPLIKSTRLMKPLIAIYNSDTKTPYEYGVALGEILKVFVEE